MAAYMAMSTTKLSDFVEMINCCKVSKIVVEREAVVLFWLIVQSQRLNVSTVRQHVSNDRNDVRLEFLVCNLD